MVLEAGIPGRDAYEMEPSPERFKDGTHYRMELTGMEGPRVLEALINDKTGVTCQCTG